MIICHSALFSKTYMLFLTNDVKDDLFHIIKSSFGIFCNIKEQSIPSETFEECLEVIAQTWFGNQDETLF